MVAKPQQDGQEKRLRNKEQRASKEQVFIPFIPSDAIAGGLGSANSRPHKNPSGAGTAPCSCTASCAQDSGRWLRGAVNGR